jgi:hypothetical protein
MDSQPPQSSQSLDKQPESKPNAEDNVVDEVVKFSPEEEAVSQAEPT